MLCKVLNPAAKPKDELVLRRSELPNGIFKAKIYNHISKTLDNDPFFSCQQQVHDFIWNKIDFSNDNDPYLKKLDQVSCACNMWAREYNTVFNLEKNHKEIKTFLEKCLSLSESIDL